MGRKQAIQTELLPGNVRIPMQLYDPNRRSYTQPAGYSLVVPRVGSAREFERIWAALQEFVDSGRWRDSARETSGPESASTSE